MRINQANNTPLILFIAFFALIMGIHIIWEFRTDMPPIWDAAHHQLKGWEYWQALQAGTLWETFSNISTHYPPLYYVQEAITLSVFAPNQFVPLLSNFLGMFLLCYCSFGIASFCMKQNVAIWAGLLTLLFPFVAWTSRISLLDGAMAGWVAAAAYCLLKSEWFEVKGWTLGFGLACAAGTLTKWTFPIYILLPLFFVLIQSKNRKNSLINLMDAMILTIPLIFLWFLPNLSDLLDRYPTTVQTSLIPWQPYPRHGEPGLTTILGWIYYPRAISSYFLFLPLTVAFVWSAIFSLKNRGDIPSSVRFLWWWLLGGILFLIFVTPKDPRFALPLAPPLAILILYPWRKQKRWICGIFLFAFVQFLSVSFESPLHPTKIALFETSDSDYQTIQQEWVLYQSHYLEVAGPPRRENWRFEEITKSMEDAQVVGFVPSVSHFHPEALQLHAFITGLDLQVRRIGDNINSVTAIDSLDVVVGKTGFQGLSYITGFNDEIYRRLKETGWHKIKVWDLPDQSQAELWKNPSPMRTNQ
ncbi:MAG: glycosyltransferase family 39 protein [Acidobacteriota bacterium]|nr:glycosyltransferase family 39 protein [Acidobacteriota bacterium]